MNENLNLVEILKDCPEGTKLYSPVFGDVELDNIDILSDHPIRVLYKYGDDSFSKDGRLFFNCDCECMLFPSKEQRDWSKFKVKSNKPKFDPKTLKPFDKVLVKTCTKSYHVWFPDFIKQKSLMIGDASGKEGQFSDSDKKTAEYFGIDYMDVNDFLNALL